MSFHRDAVLVRQTTTKLIVYAESWHLVVYNDVHYLLNEECLFISFQVPSVDVQFPYLRSM